MTEIKRKITFFKYIFKKYYSNVLHIYVNSLIWIIFIKIFNKRFNILTLFFWHIKVIVIFICIDNFRILNFR